jgi:hypothetical protein
LFDVLLLFFAVPYFRKHQGLRMLAGRHRRISSSPFASLADLLTESPAALIASDCAVLAGPRGASHELVVFVHPSCGKCDPVLQQVQALAEAGMVAAYVGLAPKDDDDADRRVCATVMAVGLSGGSMIDAYAATKKRLGAFTTGDPIATLAGELGVDSRPIDAALDEAVRRTRRAEELVDEHAEGTPAVFFDGRLYRGELPHLAFLLQNHPDLLAPMSPRTESPSVQEASNP